MRRSVEQLEHQPEHPLSSLEDPKAVVGCLLLVAAERAGSRTALCRHIGITDSELQHYLNRKTIPPVEVTLRAVDLIIDERTLRGVSARIWRALLLSDRP